MPATILNCIIHDQQLNVYFILLTLMFGLFSFFPTEMCLHKILKLIPVTLNCCKFQMDVIHAPAVYQMLGFSIIHCFVYNKATNDCHRTGIDHT